jgi:putative endonuclease
MKPKHPSHLQLLGNKGEDLAVSFLKKNGYRIVARNFKARYGEIDIICIKDNILIFVEVKTRIGHAYGTPEEAVTPWKLREVIKTAEYYSLLHKNLPEAQRIDVVGIEFDDNRNIVSFNHIQSVT